VADDQQSQQRALTSLLVADLASAWELLDFTRLAATRPEWIAAAAALIHRYSQASASLATRFYRQDRAAAGIRGNFTVPVADPPPFAQIQLSLEWATKGLWDKPPSDPQAAENIAKAHETALTKVEGMAQKLVLDVGRDTKIAAVKKDRSATAYYRATEPGACSFCALMASRGAVYKSQAAAGASADRKFVGDASDFKFHDHCHCDVKPVFKGQQYEPSPQAVAAEDLYQKVARGKSGKDALNAFRSAYESAH
jgi:hypothetical protein